MSNKMRKVSVVLPYYDNPKMLTYQFSWLKEAAAGIEDYVSVVIVDDGSPRHPAKPEDIGVDLAIYRMKMDVRWNQDACRNLGVHMAPNEWVLLTDIDHLIPTKTLHEVVRKKGLERRDLYTFTRATLVSHPNERPVKSDPYKPHPNSWFMHKTLYAACGGYDERFAGLYGTDSDFRNRAMKAAYQFHCLPVPLLRVPREVVADASTTTYERKTQADGDGIRRVKAEREAIRDWRPINLSFPWERVC